MLEKIIYSPRVASQLRKMGFEIKRTEPNKYKPQYDCYIFEQTDLFNKALDSILSKKV